MMNKKSNIVSINELSFILIGCVVGIGIMGLPSSIVAISKQDGWISTLLGGIYPLYIVLVGGIIIKKYPNNNIMDLSKAYLGKIIGNTLNFLFMLQFFFYAISAIAGASNLLRAYSMDFMPNLKIILVFVFIIIYASMKGLKVICRLSSISFFLLAFIMLTTLVPFKVSSILNVEPIFGTGIQKIIKGSMESSFSYANMELLLVIYPYVKEKKKIMKAAFISTFFIIFIYTLTVFSTIYFAGPDLVPKQLWPYLLTSESIKVPVINNFRFIFISIWIILAFKTVTIQFFAATEVFTNIIKVNRKKICIFLAPFAFVLPLFMENEVIRRDFVGKIIPWITIFNILYITIISLFALSKDKTTLNIKNMGGS